MKRFLTIALMICLCLAIGVFADEAKPVTVTLNGETVDCASYGQEATIVEGRTLVPLRAIFEALGASVEWNGERKTVVSRLDTTMIDLTVGEKELRKFTLDSEGYIINSQSVILDVPAMIMNGRTMVPARVVAESFGIIVDWDAETRTVILMSGEFAYNAYLENVLSSLLPKSELDKEILATAGGYPISAASVRSMILAACSSGMDIEDENTVNEIEGLYKQNAALANFAYNDGITLTEADINQIKSNIFALELQFGENYEEIFADSPYTEYYYYLNTSLYPILYSKIVELYSAAGGDAMRSLVLDFLNKNEYVRAKHILIQFPANADENQKKETFSKALDVLVKVKAMKDVSEFDALIEEYNEDPGMKSNPDGYYFTRGEMVAPFEQATYALAEGQTSSIVETNYGYHIILRLPVDDEKLVNSPAYKQAVGGVITDAILSSAENFEIVYADNYDERVEDFKAEYDMMFPENN